MLDHICLSEVISCFIGIMFFWSLKYSAEKDEFDDRNESFPFMKWVKDWFRKRNDNIFVHFCASYFFLIMGADTLEAWLGDFLKVPDEMNEAGSASFIGFSGSYIAGILKSFIRKQ